jgi:hypothetical protein
MKSERSSPNASRWRTVAGLFCVLCLLSDFLPRYGPPSFRYTGCDPAFHVWNLGWPLVTSIYDSRNGFHVGPDALLELPFQSFVLLVGLAIAIIRWRCFRPPGYCAVCGYALRASMVRCPECGTPVPGAAPPRKSL